MQWWRWRFRDYSVEGISTGAGYFFLSAGAVTLIGCNCFGEKGQNKEDSISITLFISKKFITVSIVLI
jgi:hypothetical protein